MALGRTLTAMAGTGLALVLALNTQVVTVTVPQPDVPSPETASEDGGPSAWGRLPRLVAPATAGADGTAAALAWKPDPEGLVMNVDAGKVTASLTSSAVEEPVEGAPKDIVVVVLPLAPEPPPAHPIRNTAL